MRLFVFLVLGFLLFCSRKNGQNGHRTEEQLTVEVITVTRQRFTEEAIYFGRLEPMETANLICYSGGRVEKINFREGQMVKKGVSLASIDGSRAYNRLETARAQLDIASSTLEQLKKHRSRGNASQLSVDQQQLTLLNAKNEFLDAQKNYRGAFAITPVSGMITTRFIEQYQELPANTPTFIVSRLDSLKIKFGITESDIYHVDPGSEVTLTIPMVQNRSWPGKIMVLARAADQENRLFSAEAYFDNKDNELKPGTSGRIQLALVTFDSAIVIPTETIIMEGVQFTVMTVDSGGIVCKKYIETGPQTDNRTMVKSGLKPGDQLIIAGFQFVRDGMAVKVNNSDERNDPLSGK